LNILLINKLLLMRTFFNKAIFQNFELYIKTMNIEKLKLTKNLKITSSRNIFINNHEQTKIVFNKSKFF